MSEIRNIPLGGVSNEPNDYNAEDGGLSVSINAVKHHGSLRPVMPGSPVKDIGGLAEGADVVAIHEVGEMKHYILLWEDTAAESKPTEVKYYLYYENLPGRVKVWWDTLPKQYDFGFTQDDQTLSTWQMQVVIGSGDNVYTQIVEQRKAIEIPGSGLCVSIDGSGGGVIYYDFENDKVVTDAYIKMRILKSTGETEELGDGKLIKVNTNKHPQTEGVPDEADDTEGKYMLMYIDANANDKTEKEIASFSDKVIGVSAMGNVLTIARKGKPLTYVIWKDAEYRKLGSRLPGLKVTPYLVSSPAYIGENGTVFSGEWEVDNSLTDLSNDVYTDQLKYAIEDERTLRFTPEQKNALASKVFGVINLAHNSLADNGYFYAPFLVRFALRMYDRTHIMHTPPQLMIAGAAGKPIVGVHYVTGDSDNHPFLRTVFCASRLCANIDITDVETWRDLVTHVDVFVSPPLVDYADSPDSIHQFGVANIPHNLTDIPVYNNKEMPEYNPLYMKDFKTIGNLYEDYLDMANHPFEITYNTLHKGKNYENLHKNISAGIFSPGYLLVKHGTEYTMTIDGQAAILKPVTGSEVVVTIDGQDYKLEDTNIPELSEYAYYKYNEGQDLRNVKFTSQNNQSPVIYTAKVYGLKRNRTQYITNTIHIETHTEAYLDKIVENNTFHLIKSIAIQDIADGWKGDLSIPKHILPIVRTQKELSDNGQRRSRSFCDIPAFAYNNRLSVAVQKESLPTSARIVDFCAESSSRDNYIEAAWIKATVNGQEVYKQLEIGTDGDRPTYAENIRYFYYPDHNATHLILQVFNKDGKALCA